MGAPRAREGPAVCPVWVQWWSSGCPKSGDLFVSKRPFSRKTSLFYGQFLTVLTILEKWSKVVFSGYLRNVSKKWFF